MITLSGIYKSFYQGELETKVLKNINLTISRGEYVAILGPSGSGKSTLMNILGCLDVPSKGQYSLDGKEVSQCSMSELAEIRNQKIGFIFQSFHLLPHADALQNVALPLVYRGLSYKERMKKAKAMLAEVGLSDRAHHKPSELSGGQRQRVAIARALVTNPDIILADEPTGNLDSKTGEEVIKLFEELLSQGKTLIMVTHDLKMAKRAGRVIRLLDGQYQNDTTPLKSKELA